MDSLDSLYVTLYTGPRSLVNAQILGIHNNRWDVRLSASLQRIETLFATFWLDGGRELPRARDRIR